MGWQDHHPVSEALISAYNGNKGCSGNGGAPHYRQRLCEIDIPLRSISFRGNRYLKQWEGEIDYADADILIEGQGGKLSKSINLQRRE